MKKIKDAIAHFNYGINCELFSEPVMSHSKLAVKALEKLMPKKPIYSGDGYDDKGELIYDSAECPCCGNNDFEYGINNWGCNYCPECGQSLDWGECDA